MLLCSVMGFFKRVFVFQDHVEPLYGTACLTITLAVFMRLTYRFNPRSDPRDGGSAMDAGSAEDDDYDSTLPGGGQFA